MKKQKFKITTAYLYNVYNLDKYEKTFNKTVAAIRKFKKSNPFDAIAFSGTSGAALAYPLSLKLKVPLICVHKYKTHSSLSIEGVCFPNKYIIVDDLIESGSTIKRIIKKIKIYHEEFKAFKLVSSQKGPEPVGIVLYNRNYSLYQSKFNNIPIIKI
jgi:adenine/guanine phosphoribosyltransferase-like PRPP-binding protein